jgi:hypothetical protein
MAQGHVTGLMQYLLWGVSTPTSGTGVVSGGDLSVDPDARQRQGIGGQEIRRGGLCKFGGKADLYVTALNQALCAYGLRASYPSGALTVLQLEGGADEWGRQYTDALITDLGLDFAQGEGFKASLGWGSLGIAASSGGAMVAETNLDLEDYEWVVSFGGTEYSVQAFGIKVNNNVTFKSAADTKTANQKRWPQWANTGAEELTVDLTTELPLPAATLDLWEDLLPSNLGAVMTGSNGTNTLALTLTNLQPSGPESFGLVDSNTPVQWKYAFRGSSYSGSLAWAWS